ncbi:hypothetical protein [Dysgonomonas sp. GY617]|uniref:hypothetical protein n=1 Tax=Dysgonomonas sp. GY617 TaxID=2780420 RepID=UPI00188460D5|nr:hypothetical protein [Dysgonomonas sp. GY617]MBF0575988.1 hypothetical protein [Dysgonomonas sp. GY617]
MAIHYFIVSSETAQQKVSTDCENYVNGIFQVIAWAMKNFPEYICIYHTENIEGEFLPI